MDSIVRARAGLGDLPERLRERECTVAYLGASVMVQRNGYRPLLHEWLERRSGRQHRAINAAVGATGSVSGVFLMDDLVLRHRPDLCFVDYSPGDIETQSPPGELGPAIEGIVRKLRRAECGIVILHSYRYDRRFDPPERVIETWEQVADHYGVASVNLGRWVEAAIRDGSQRGDELLADGIHTTRRGAEVLTGVLSTCVEPLLERSTVIDPTLPSPLYARDYTATAIVPAEVSMARDPSLCSEGRFRLVVSYIQLVGDNALEASFAGELVGVVLIAGGERNAIRIGTAEQSFELSIWDAQAPVDRYATAVLPVPAPPRAAISVSLVGEGALKVVGFMVRG